MSQYLLIAIRNLPQKSAFIQFLSTPSQLVIVSPAINAAEQPRLLVCFDASRRALRLWQLPQGAPAGSRRRALPRGRVGDIGRQREQ
jgi:hypothetical protein